MKVIYLNSLTIDLTPLHGKTFKMAADLIRSGIKNIHGYRALKGITDICLKEGSLAIRFKTPRDRQRFIHRLSSLLRDKILDKINIQKTKPKKASAVPVRFVRNR